MWPSKSPQLCMSYQTKCIMVQHISKFYNFGNSVSNLLIIRYFSSVYKIYKYIYFLTKLSAILIRPERILLTEYARGIYFIESTVFVQIPGDRVVTVRWIFSLGNLDVLWQMKFPDVSLISRFSLNLKDFKTF